jgi:hypothetical protein
MGPGSPFFGLLFNLLNPVEVWMVGANINSRTIENTPTLQKSRMPQILGVEGEAVVLYREPSTTKEMRYPRLSRRVNKMAAFSCFQDATCSEHQQGIENEKIACIRSF